MFDKTMVRGLLVAAFAISVSNAWAGDITYNIVDFPANQVDQVLGGDDHISGQIVTDGTTGNYTDTTHIISSTFSLKNTAGQTFDFPDAIASLYNGSLQVSTTALQVPQGASSLSKHPRMPMARSHSSPGPPPPPRWGTVMPFYSMAVHLDPTPPTPRTPQPLTLSAPVSNPLSSQTRATGF